MHGFRPVVVNKRPQTERVVLIFILIVQKEAYQTLNRTPVWQISRSVSPFISLTVSFVAPTCRSMYKPTYCTYRIHVLPSSRVSDTCFFVLVLRLACSSSDRAFFCSGGHTHTLPQWLYRCKWLPLLIGGIFVSRHRISSDCIYLICPRQWKVIALCIYYCYLLFLWEFTWSLKGRTT